VAHMTAHDGFAWTSEEWGLALRSDALGRVADHFFTTRQLRLRGESEAEDWRLVAGAIGVPPSRLLRLTQVHGCEVFLHREGDPLPGVQARPAADTSDDAGWPPADISMTDDPTVALAIQVADCVPLLLSDPLTGAVAAVHAGWRGTAAGAAIAAVEALGREFGARPERLVVAQGPSIGRCCYTVGDELIDAYRAGGFAQSVDRWFIRDEAGGLKLDVRAANRDQLIASGIPAASIHAANLCTAGRPDLFASYRRDGPGTGRIAAVIRSRRGGK
jgi:YfiH family protein